MILSTKSLIIILIHLKFTYCIYINKVIKVNELNLVNYFSSFECGTGVCKAQFRIRRVLNEYSSEISHPNIPPIGLFDYSNEIFKFSVYTNITLSSNDLCKSNAEPKMTKSVPITPYWSDPINISLEQNKKPYTWYFVLMACDSNKVRTLIAQSNQNNKWRITNRESENTNNIYVHIQGNVFQSNGSHYTYKLPVLKNLLLIEMIIHLLIFLMLIFYVFYNKIKKYVQPNIFQQILIKLIISVSMNFFVLFLEISNINYIREYGEPKTIISILTLSINNICKMLISYILFTNLFGIRSFNFRNKTYLIEMLLLLSHSWLDKFPNYYLLTLDPSTYVSQKKNFIYLSLITLIIEIQWYNNKSNFNKLGVHKLMNNIRTLGYLHLFAYPISHKFSEICFRSSNRDIFVNICVYSSRIIIHFYLLKSLIYENYLEISKNLDFIDLLPINNGFTSKTKKTRYNIYNCRKFVD